MKTSAQMTTVEPTIRTPAWRSDSPKKRNTRSPHTKERDHDGLVHRTPYPLRAARSRHALVAADNRDDRPEHRALQHRAPQVGDRGVGEQRVPERPRRTAAEQLGQKAAEDPEQESVDVEQARYDHQRQKARHDEVLDGINAQYLEGVELLSHLARAKVRGDRRSGDARND